MPNSSDQWVYTSTCWGIYQRSGFQTFSHSEGITPDEEADLEKYCANYKVFSDAPYNPAPEQIRELFPIHYHCISLSSGRRAMARILFLGTGWMDGRPGNFLSHAFVYDNKDLSGVSIEYYDSPDFWNDIPKEAKDEGLRIWGGEIPYRPYEFLPRVDMPQLSTSGNYSMQNTVLWCHDKDFAHKISCLENAFFTKKQPNQPLVFSDDYHENPRIIAAFLSLFPRKIANSMNYATHMDIEEKPLDFLSTFQLLGALNSSCDLDLRQLPKEPVSCPLLEVNLRCHNAYHAWADTLESLSISELPSSARTFLFCQNIVKNPSPKQALSALDFLGTWSPSHPLTNSFWKTVFANSALWTDQTLPILIPPLASWLSRQTSQTAHAVLNFLSKWLLQKCPVEQWSEYLALFSRNFGNTFDTFWLSPENCTKLLEFHNNNQSPRLAGTLFDFMLEVRKRLQGTLFSLWEESPEWSDTLFVSASRDAEWLEKLLSNCTWEEFLFLWQRLPAIWYPQSVPYEEPIARVLANAEAAWEIRRNMLDSKEYEKLARELEQQLASLKQPWDFFFRYEEEILRNSHEYQTVVLPRVLPRLSFENLNSNQIRWFVDKLPSWEVPVQIFVMNSLTGSIPLEKPDNERLEQLELLLECAQALNPPLKCERVEFLLWSVSTARKPPESEEIRLAFETWKPFLLELSESEKKVWVEWWLPAILGQTLSMELHLLLMETLSENWKNTSFLEFYVQKVVKSVPKIHANTVPETISPFLASVLFLISDDTAANFLIKVSYKFILKSYNSVKMDSLYLKMKKFLTIQGPTEDLSKSHLFFTRWKILLAEKKRNKGPLGIFRRMMGDVLDSVNDLFPGRNDENG